MTLSEAIEARDDLAVEEILLALRPRVCRGSVYERSGCLSPDKQSDAGIWRLVGTRAQGVIGQDWIEYVPDPAHACGHLRGREVEDCPCCGR